MMIPTIICLGLSHRTAPVALREQLSCTLADIWPKAVRQTAVTEMVVLSTCNRLELYVTVSPDSPCPHSALIQLFADMQGVPADIIAAHSYTFTDAEAIHHLLQVAAGLDSLVLGEPQILGQVNAAYQTAVAAGTAQSVLDVLFKAALRTGKRGRSETAISRNPATVSSVAIALAQQVLGDLRARQILIVGAGEMGRLAVKSLQQRGIQHVSVANRSKAKAQTAVAQFYGRAYSLDELPLAIAAADVVITAVQSATPLIDSNIIIRRERPLVIVDIAVPRNVATAVAKLPQVTLFDVDDLQATLDESLVKRQAELPRVQAIITAETKRLNGQLRELSIRPLLVDMRRKADQIRESELERTLRHLGDIDPQTMAHIQHFSRSLVNKLLHEPTLRLKEKANCNEAAGYTATLRDLFGLVEDF